MTLAVVEVARVTAQAWRNGGGVTRELLTWPAAQAWALRISVADIERDGPFSAFPGIERVFTVLEGDGVALAFDDGERRQAAPGDLPFRFDGGRAVQCTLRGRATRDLNVMSVRKRGRASVDVARGGEARHARCDLRALFAQDATRLVHGHVTAEVPAMALAWSAHPAGTWRMLDDARAYWIELDTRGAA